MSSFPTALNEQIARELAASQQYVAIAVYYDSETLARLALEQEKRVTEDIVTLAKLAREETDLVGEQFLHWFLQEQREEVASMSSLLAVTERAGDNLLLVEEYLARTGSGGEAAVPSPAAAGGAL